MKIWIILAGLNAAMAVGMGAYGWHNLSDVPEIRDVFMMGTQYQMWHALAMLGTGLLIDQAKQMSGHKLLHGAGGCFQGGIVLFSGTLYAFGLINIVPVSGAAPIGGTLLMGGWLLLAWHGALKVAARQQG